MENLNCERCRHRECVSSTHELEGNQMTITESCSQCKSITTTKYTVEVIFKQTVHENKSNFLGTLPSEEKLGKLCMGLSEDHHAPNENH